MNDVLLVIEERETEKPDGRKITSFHVFLQNKRHAKTAVLWRFFPADIDLGYTKEEHQKAVEHVQRFIEPLLAVLDVPVNYRKTLLVEGSSQLLETL